MKVIAKTNLFEARFFNPEDASIVASWMSVSPKDLFMLSSSLSLPVKPEMLIERAEKSDPQEHKFYSVFLKETNNIVGYFEIKNINFQHKIGTGAHVILSPEYRGKGKGRDFVGLMSKIAFTILGLYRISVSVHTVNHAAIAVYEKAGYVREGLLREVLVFNGKRYSLYQMSLLRSEWERRC